MRFSIRFPNGWLNRLPLGRKIPGSACLVLGLLMGSFAWGELPEIISGLVSAVHDGDTITVMSEKTLREGCWKEERGQEYRIRFQAVDAPEQGQSGGWESKWFLTCLIGGEMVSVKVEKKDKFGRYVGRIFLENADGTGAAEGVWDVEKEMILQGHAWHYSYFNQETELAGAEKVARREKRGLWEDECPTPPWKYRAAMKKRDGAVSRQ
ncbi:MAG: thermonuclease family protein [Planctomycetia bacterium]|nr:thermonuclease family protein [Planctomycetia bacterium]